VFAAAVVAILRQPWVDLRLYSFAILPSITVQTMGFAFELMERRVVIPMEPALNGTGPNRIIPILLAAFFGALYMGAVSVFVTIWPLTPNVHIVYPFRGAEVSRFEKIAGSFVQLPPDKDMWVEVSTQETDHNHYFSSVAIHRDEGTWETRGIVGFGREPGKGDEGQLYSLVVYLSPPELSQTLRGLGADTGRGINQGAIPHGLTQLKEAEFRRKTN